MDFGLTDVQEEIRSLTRELLDSRISAERLAKIEQTEDGFDRETWTALAEANLVGIGLPEDVGGSGLGLVEVAVVLAEVGRAVAPVPMLASIGRAAYVIGKHASAAQRQAILPGVVSGESLITAAIDEPGNQFANTPSTVATRTDGGWLLSGRKSPVPWLGLVDRILVTATTDAGVAAAFLVEPHAGGVTIAEGISTTRQPAGTLDLVEVFVGDDDVLGDPSTSATADDVYRTAVAATLAVGIGVVTRDLEITAAYTIEREVFGKPVATYQGPVLRMADAFVDIQAITVTAWEAIWRLSEGHDADVALDTAKFWMAEGGQRVVHSGQHLHGGTGADTGYPIHRYLLWLKELQFALGGATPTLLRLGAALVGADSSSSKGN